MMAVTPLLLLLEPLSVDWLVRQQIVSAAAKVSGVIAVVVYGLYGSATAKWGLSPKVAEHGIFDNFWDTIGFAVSGMVFFFSGCSSVNFFVRSAKVSLPRHGRKHEHLTAVCMELQVTCANCRWRL